MKQTALEWLLENIISEPYSQEDWKHNSDCWDKAEEMEKQQSHEYAEFAIRCDRDNLPILEFIAFIKL